MSAILLKREFIITEDGSHTLFVPELNEHYHSIHGAIQESMHVFIQTGLNTFTDKKDISIFEVGFGTGLNALLTLREAISQQKNIKYTTIEKYPIRLEEIEILNYPNALGGELKNEFELLHNADWGSFSNIDLNKNKTGEATFNLKKVHLDLRNFAPENTFDLIYFDAFSPNVQPELWSEEVFNTMYQCLNVGGILVTYSAKGFVKRNLRSAGFLVKRLPGPLGKREMLRASKFSVGSR